MLLNLETEPCRACSALMVLSGGRTERDGDSWPGVISYPRAIPRAALLLCDAADRRE